jgi:hypothetical protein
MSSKNFSFFSCVSLNRNVVSTQSAPALFSTSCCFQHSSQQQSPQSSIHRLSQSYMSSSKVLKLCPYVVSQRETRSEQDVCVCVCVRERETVMIVHLP